MGSETRPLEAADLELLDRVAGRVVELRLEVPAILTLESIRPLAFVAGQSLVFFQPLVQAFLRVRDYERFAALVERREALDELAARIERRADGVRAARTAARAGKAS
jgi:hypothetical protein